MQKTNIFKAIMVAVVGMCAVTFASCDDSSEPKNDLKLSATTVEVAPKATSTVTIGAGTAPYSVSSSNSKVATAAVKDKVITISGVAEGNAVITVTDKAKKTGQIVVAVKTPLTADKASAEIAVGKTAEVTVSNGTAPYTATVKDSKVATASVNGSKVTIKGVKAGKTTVTVTDKNKRSVTISVTVK